MPVFRWGHTWGGFGDLEQEVDRLLRGVRLTMPGVALGRPYPAINMYEVDGEFLLTAELPGTRPEDLEISISRGVLTIKGRRVDPEEISDDKFRRHERFRGTWQRALTLPERVKEDQLSADFRNGLLTIHLPKADEAPIRRIPVVGGNE
jgi:HSP20 family protein